MRFSALRRAFSSALVLLFCLVPFLSSCARFPQKRYTKVIDGPFDTVTQLVICARRAADAAAFFDRFEAELFAWDELADIYFEYDGLNNLKTLNRAAGGAPVALDASLLDLLEYGLAMREATGGRVDLLLGSVLSLWHACREKGLNDPAAARIPTDEELAEAARIAEGAALVIDRGAGTAYLPLAGSSVDVGAFAKGYATEMICRELESLGYTDFAANVGGNLRVSGSAAGKPWELSVRDPEGDGTIGTVARSGAVSLSTSGSYQRFYTVDGVRYHHIIDPDTNAPAALGWVSVSVLTDDAGVADILSTALFLLGYEEGVSLLSGLTTPASALWIADDGSIYTVGAFDEGGGS